MNDEWQSEVELIHLLPVADTDKCSGAMSTAIIFVLLMCSVLCHVDVRPEETQMERREKERTGTQNLISGFHFNAPTVICPQNNETPRPY